MRKRLEKVGAGMIGYPSFLANEAAKAAFSRCDDWLAALRDYLQGNRDFMMQFIKENMPDIKMFQPQGTYLAWLDCSRLDLQPDPHHFFLDEAKVALNDGVTFGANGSGYVRLNFGCPRSTLETALKQMAAALE
jgi:cystathionine beta-lyase